jgi:hypothetical protein
LHNKNYTHRKNKVLPSAYVISYPFA